MTSATKPVLTYILIIQLEISFYSNDEIS